MNYFFQLGSNPRLSTAEIFSIFHERQDINMRLLSADILLLKTDEKIDMENIIKKTGGIIKIGLVEDEIKNKFSIDEMIEKVLPLIKISDKKIKYGFSYYGKINIDPKKLGMTLKNKLKEKNINSRWVQGKEKILSSVIVEQNKLINNGIEINFIQDGTEILIARTLAVQPFKELSFRDYGRPSRDDESGMLPPKLAMMMLNLAKIKENDIILDPFCGSGTVVTEAMNQEHKNIIGTDKSGQAILDTNNNIAWIQRKFNLNSSPTIFQADASHLSQIKKFNTKYPDNKIDKIITEPYLGPQRGSRDFHKIKKELNHFYSQILSEFSKILNQNGKIVMVWPIFLHHEKKIFLNPNLNNLQITKAIPENFLQDNNLKLSFRNTIHYGREGQKVWREIVILSK